MKCLWKLIWDVGRMGRIESIFIASEEEVSRAIGKQIYFGEILGKHSEVQGVLEEADLTRLTDDQEFIEKFADLDCIVGYNPLNYIMESD